MRRRQNIVPFTAKANRLRPLTQKTLDSSANQKKSAEIDTTEEDAEAAEDVVLAVDVVVAMLLDVVYVMLIEGDATTVEKLGTLHGIVGPPAAVGREIQKTNLVMVLRS